jgi:lisH domain-containing protein FOPNL
MKNEKFLIMRSGSFGHDIRCRLSNRRGPIASVPDVSKENMKLDMYRICEKRIMLSFSADFVRREVGYHEIFNVLRQMDSRPETSIYETTVALMKERGAFSKITAEIRAEVYHLLTRDAEHDRSVPVCRENFIINELIREYLLFNGLEQTLSVLIPETGQPREPLNRDFLAHSLKIPVQQQTPLLNSLVQRYRRADQPPPPKRSEPAVERPERGEKPIDAGESSDGSPGFFEINS